MYTHKKKKYPCFYLHQLLLHKCKGFTNGKVFMQVQMLETTRIWKDKIIYIFTIEREKENELQMQSLDSTIKRSVWWQTV